jgi:ubiquinone/menaquinone biosynthesis C-methylase UbiE
MDPSARLNKDKRLWERKFVVSNYDDDALQKLKYRHIIDRAISEIGATDAVVEVACGTGLVSFEAARQAREVYATDISSEMIERCKSKQRDFNLNNIAFT